MPRPPIAVFDLDGTLADTARDLVATLNVVLDREGLPSLSVEEGRAVVNHGAKALVAHGIAAAGRDIAPARLDELHAFFLVHYGEHVCDHTRLFPGVREALDRLRSEGFRLAICTSKNEAYALEILDGLGIGDRFDAICGRESFPYLKPDPRHLLLTIDRAGGDPARAVMIGDSLTDVATARAAGIPVVLVSFGYSDVPAEALEADVVIDRYDELFGAVQGLMRIAA
jgi:phosphoglycolate phosphatase